jgi:hypothetical protein
MILPTTTSGCAWLRGARGWTSGGAPLNAQRSGRASTCFASRVESESRFKAQVLAYRLGELP